MSVLCVGSADGVPASRTGGHDASITSFVPGDLDTVLADASFYSDPMGVASSGSTSNALSTHATIA